MIASAVTVIVIVIIIVLVMTTATTALVLLHLQEPSILRKSSVEHLDMKEHSSSLEFEVQHQIKVTTVPVRVSSTICATCKDLFQVHCLCNRLWRFVCLAADSAWT